MAEIHINKDDINSIVESYSTIDNTFVIKSFSGADNKKTCKFYIEGKECKVIFYIKKKSVNIVPIGNNIEECSKLIEFIASKGFSTNAKVKQFVFSCTKSIIDNLIAYIEDECHGLVSLIQNNNIYKFIGYNSDELTFTFYPTTNKAMIQGKPFHTYSIIVSYLSSLDEYSFEEIVEINNAFTDMNTPSDSIRNLMKTKLENAYTYLDEALLKSISGSLTMLKQKESSEDYTGCVTGEFKALEGYLKKILTKKYKYKLTRNKTFKMFYKSNGNSSDIELDQNIDEPSKKQLNNLYSMYSNKRNVYLHSTIDPSQTRIMSTLKEAKDLSEEILNIINNSYQVIFE